MVEGPPPLVDVQRRVVLDPVGFAAAFTFVEDSVIWRRDNRVSVPAANGVVVLEADGTESSAIRLSTRNALALGISAYVASIRLEELLAGLRKLRCDLDAEDHDDVGFWDSLRDLLDEFDHGRCGGDDAGAGV